MVWGSIQTIEEAEAEIERLAVENERLRRVLTEARAEVDRWGHGDFHYGNSPRDKGVLAMLAKIDAVLDEPGAGLTNIEGDGSDRQRETP